MCQLLTTESICRYERVFCVEEWPSIQPEWQPSLRSEGTYNFVKLEAKRIFGIKIQAVRILIIPEV